MKEELSKYAREIREVLGEGANPEKKRWKILEACFDASKNGLCYAPITKLLSHIYSENTSNEFVSNHWSRALGDIDDIIKTIEKDKSFSNRTNPIKRPLMRLTEKRLVEGDFKKMWLTFVPVTPTVLFQDLSRLARHVMKSSENSFPNDLIKDSEEKILRGKIKENSEGNSERRGRTSYEYMYRNDTLFEIYLLIFLSRLRKDLIDNQLLLSRIRELLNSPRLMQKFQSQNWKRTPALLLSGDLRLTPFQALVEARSLTGSHTDETDLSLPHQSQYNFIAEIKEALESSEVGNVAVGRDDILEEIKIWITGEQKKNIYAISGGPGTGKSTIIATYLHQMPKSPCFIVDHRFGEKGRPKRILAHLITELNSLCGQPSNSPHPESDGHALELFLAALELFSQTRSLLKLPIVIDGLDETEGNPYQEKSLSQLLLQIKNDIPDGIRFILSSRPTESFRKLVGAFDINLDEDDCQTSAIYSFYNNRLAKLLNDPNYSLDLDDLSTRTQRSFLYAELAVQDILVAYNNERPYDVTAAPTGLTEQLESEWERTFCGPLDRGKTGRLLAVLSVLRVPVLLDELCGLTGIESPEVVAFFTSHGHLFKVPRENSDTLDTRSTVSGFWHVAFNNYFSHKLGLQALKEAHGSVAQWLLLRRSRSGSQDFARQCEEIMYHLMHAEDWAKCTKFLCSADTIHALRITPHGIAMLPCVYGTLIESGARSCNFEAIVQGAFLSAATCLTPELPVSSLLLSLGDSEQALSSFKNLSSDHKTLESKRLAFLGRKQGKRSIRDLIGLLQPWLDEPASLQDAAIHPPEVLISLPTNTWHHIAIADSPLITNPCAAESFLMTKLVRSENPGCVAYVKDVIGELPSSSIDWVLPETLIKSHPKIALEIVRCDAPKWLPRVPHDQRVYLARIAGDINVLRDIVLQLDAKALSSLEIENVLLFSAQLPINESKVLLDRGAFVQSVLTAQSEVLIQERGIHSEDILVKVTDWRYRTPLLKTFSRIGIAVDWPGETQSLANHLSKHKSQFNWLRVADWAAVVADLQQLPKLRRTKLLRVFKDLLSICPAYDEHVLCALSFLCGKPDWEVLNAAIQEDAGWTFVAIDLLQHKPMAPEERLKQIASIECTLSISLQTAADYRKAFEAKNETNNYSRQLAEIKLLTLLEVSSDTTLSLLDQLDPYTILWMLTSFVERPWPENRLPWKQLYDALFPRFDDDAKWKNILPAFINLFWQTASAKVGELIATKYMFFHDFTSIFPVLQIEDDAWRLGIELFAFLHFKSCGENFESQFHNLLSQVYTWQDRDAKKFFTWCCSLDYADNRFCPVSLKTTEFKRFAEQFKECVQQAAFECLAREDPEGAMETTSLWDNWSNALFAINPLAFCTLWEHVAAHNFAFAVDVFKWMTSPDIVRWFGISAHRVISLAWHILVGEATCGNTGAHDEKNRVLLALAEQTYGSYKPDITEEPYFTLWSAVFAATGWCSPEFVSDFLEKVPPDVVSKYGSVIGISMIRRHCDALVFLSNRKVHLGLDDAEKVAPLLIEHLTDCDARDWCLETQRLWELFPGIPCNEVLDLAIEELAKRRKPITRLAGLANFLTDETMQCTALVRIMESAQGTLEERKDLLTKALVLLGHVNSDTPSFAAALFNLCRIVSQWPKEDAKLALQSIYNIAKKTPWGDNALRPEILIEPIRFMARVAPQYAAEWSAEINDENVLASIIEEWASEDLNAAVEFACTVASRLQQSGKILWDKGKICSDTLGLFLFLLRGANSWSDYLLFQDEEERRIHELARSNIVGALEAAACRPNSEAFVRRLCCNLPVTLDETIVQWFAEECRPPLRAWIADLVIERIIHSEACRALNIIAGMDRDDLLEAFVEGKNSWDSYTLDRLSRTAFDFIDKKSGADLDYDQKRIRILARAALCRAETYGCFRVMAWVAKNCPELILELLPEFLERLAATCTNPEEVVSKATSAMKQAHTLQSVGIR